MSSLTEDLKKLAVLKEHKADAKADYEEYGRRHAELEADVLARMEEDGINGLKHDGINFVPAKTPYGSINDRAAFIKWCEESGEEHLLERKERKDQINALIRRHLDDGEPLPPGVTFYVKEYVSQRAG